MRDKHIRISEKAGVISISLYYRYRLINTLLYSAVILYCAFDLMPSFTIGGLGRYLVGGLLGIIVSLIALQVLFGLAPEVITIDKNIMTVDHRVGPIVGRHELYDLSQIQNIHLASVPKKRKNAWGYTREIVFDYCGKEVHLGRDLSEEAANELMNGPFKQVLQSATP
jgi:hypothetical protein